jgi:hypothetical protein
VPVSRTGSSLRGRLAARSPALQVDGADPARAGRGDSPWTLSVLAFALCVITAVSLFANGNAATALLALGLAAVVLGVPAYLVIAQLHASRPTGTSHLR